MQLSTGMREKSSQGVLRSGVVGKTCFNVYADYKHLSSHRTHFMRYNRRKWKPLIG